MHSPSSPNHLVLASASPRRRELLRQIGVAFTPVAVGVAEKRAPGETPESYVRRLALDKARAGLERLGQGAVVLGADTLGELDGQVLEKPVDQSHAAQMLKAMSGRTHRVLSAVALTDGRKERVAMSVTEVTFRRLSDEEIARYWHTGEPRDKAGGYAIQGRGAVFVESIRGSYSAVVGLPLELTQRLLAEYNIPVWNTVTVSEGDCE